ncbi:hypothetical protein Csa_005932 [Cucumis sativus]|uniref:Uncharacterized protein n=1 Tax=Cucumis sativus TaxID=3659 RepID=A0A0A0LIP2_CUCSA|nr:hypothetical protein Csa_005932 [Cucumis sativus]
MVGDNYRPYKIHRLELVYSFNGVYDMTRMELVIPPDGVYHLLGSFPNGECVL